MSFNGFMNWLKNVAHKLAASDLFAKIAPKVVPPADRFVHKISGGRILLGEMLMPSLLLTSTGAKSGQLRESPLATIPYRGNTLVIGSNWGGKKHPAWSYNLIANPDASISLHGKEIDVRAELLTSDEKAVAWPEIVSTWPPFDKYVERSGRDLRVFRLVERA